jgi:thiamine-monophosphate kinase
MDTLVEGVHFLPDVDPSALGHKALAVNLSDLAAMGAEPVWATLSLTLPRADEGWLAGFSRGFSDLARRFGVQLVGGDTTRGPLSITVAAHGLLEATGELRRSGAGPGDLIYVTGSLGDAGLALLARQGLYVDADGLGGLFARLERPEPRVAEGLALRGRASAAIDVSDGLAADLGHLCRASAVGATIQVDRLPCSRPVRTYVEETGDWSLPLAAGDDYELCFTVPTALQGEVEALAGSVPGGLTWIGMVERQPGVRCCYPDGQTDEAPTGFDHFALHE